MVNPPLVSQRYGSLAWAAFTLPHQEATVDPTTEQVLGGVARHWPVVPRMLLQAVYRGDVIAGHPALPVLGLGFTPFLVVIIAQDTELFTLP